MSIATKICNNFVRIVLCPVIIVQLIDILKELTQKGEGTKKVNEQNRAYAVLREPESLELLTEDVIYSLSDMKAC